MGLHHVELTDVNILVCSLPMFYFSLRWVLHPSHARLKKKKKDFVVCISHLARRTAPPYRASYPNHFLPGRPPWWPTWLASLPPGSSRAGALPRPPRGVPWRTGRASENGCGDSPALAWLGHFCLCCLFPSAVMGPET